MVESVTIKNAQLTPEIGKQGMEAPAEEPSSDKPSWLPEKFKSGEDLAKAYTELEKAYSGRNPTQEETTTPEVTKEAVEQQTGMSLDPFYDEFAQNGSLSDESYEKLNESGLSKELVDSYIQGQMALADQSVSEIQNSVGGEKQYQAIVEWASQNLEDSEIATFNKQIEDGTIDEAKFSIKALESRYKLANGVEPNLVQGTKAGAGADTFRSVQQVVEAMNDPRYESDPAYRDEVARRMKNSDIM